MVHSRIVIGDNVTSMATKVRYLTTDGNSGQFKSLRESRIKDERSFITGFLFLMTK